MYYSRRDATRGKSQGNASTMESPHDTDEIAAKFLLDGIPMSMKRVISYIACN